MHDLEKCISGGRQSMLVIQHTLCFFRKKYEISVQASLTEAQLSWEDYRNVFKEVTVFNRPCCRSNEPGTMTVDHQEQLVKYISVSVTETG